MIYAHVKKNLKQNRKTEHARKYIPLSFFLFAEANQKVYILVIFFIFIINLNDITLLIYHNEQLYKDFVL